jgi:hypothetical protein
MREILDKKNGSHHQHPVSDALPQDSLRGAKGNGEASQRALKFLKLPEEDEVCKDSSKSLSNRKTHGTLSLRHEATKKGIYHIISPQGFVSPRHNELDTSTKVEMPNLTAFFTKARAESKRRPIVKSVAVAPLLPSDVIEDSPGLGQPSHISSPTIAQHSYHAQQLHKTQLQKKKLIKSLGLDDLFTPSVATMRTPAEPSLLSVNTSRFGAGATSVRLSHSNLDMSGIAQKIADVSKKKTSLMSFAMQPHTGRKQFSFPESQLKDLLITKIAL